MVSPNIYWRKPDLVQTGTDNLQGRESVINHFLHLFVVFEIVQSFNTTLLEAVKGLLVSIGYLSNAMAVVGETEA